MSVELVLILVVLAAATFPVLRELRRRSPGRFGGALGVAWGAGVLGVCGLASLGKAPWALRTADERPSIAPSDDYVSSSDCQSCHPSQYETWHSSYHRTMATLAVEGNVFAPFDGRLLEDGLAERGRLVPFRKGDEYWVELVDPYHEGPGPAPIVQRRVVQVTGSHHQQLYWFATGQTRALGLFPYGWRVDEQRWLPVDALFLTPPRGEQSKILGRWNSSCSKCHATHGKPRFEGPKQMDTTVTELGIACEMCHGPGEEHVAANRDPLRRYRLHEEGEGDPTIVDPSKLSPERSTQVCGQCHGITYIPTPELRRQWVEEGFSFRPGDDLLETRGLGEPDADAADRKFWKDGQVRVTGREYTALLRTPCFRSGQMSCLSCHVLHQKEDDPRPLDEWRNDLLAPGMDGDQACTQCHHQFDEPAALVAHTHHAVGSSGSGCLDCHMPYTSYGQQGGIRSHDVEPPTVQASLATGRPNSCNQCHLDRSLEWTSHWLAEWYGEEQPALDENQRALAASVLWTLQGDAGQRALMAWSLGWPVAVAAGGGPWRLPYLALLMNDPYHVVRFIAARAARTFPEYEGLAYDHLKSSDERLEVTSELLERWQASQRSEVGSAGVAYPALLMRADGSWDEEAVQRLLSGRDESDVVLQE